MFVIEQFSDCIKKVLVKPSDLVHLQVKSSHHYLYSAFYNADCVKAALWY